MITDHLRGLAVARARTQLTRMSAGSREIALALAGRGDGPRVLPGPPEGPVLVIAPHPDDEAIGPGGAIARHVDAGHDVQVLLVTSGGASAGAGADVETVREAESARACAHLGSGVQIVHGRLTDGGLSSAQAEVADLISDHAGGIATIYVPSLLDPHPDHHAVAVALAQAEVEPTAHIHAYEVWSAGPVDVLLDVTDVFARKQAALAEYHVALRTVDYVRSASGLAAYRSAAGGMGGRGFAEGFTVHTPEEYRELVTGS